MAAAPTWHYCLLVVVLLSFAGLFAIHPMHEEANAESRMMAKIERLERRQLELANKIQAFGSQQPPTGQSGSRGGVPLIVGGSDGSGTRGVVATLKQLGVNMVVEDKATLDVHADEVGGWPPVVAPVLEQSRGAAYEVSLLPRPVVEGARQALRTLIASWSDRGTQSRLTATATGVSWGIKAPCSMLLMPFWAEMLPKQGGFKFLHVVRDGRDIAFSANTSPVRKFYEPTFGGAHGRNLPVEVKAIELWSTWNADLLQWEEQRRRSAGPAAFDFLLLHSEDLVRGPPQDRLKALKQLADFVGSTASDQDLCGIVAQQLEAERAEAAKRAEQRGSSTVATRYGKWQAPLRNNPALNRTIHEIGARGLSVFGYAPARDWHRTLPAVPLAGPQCARLASAEWAAR